MKHEKYEQTMNEIVQKFDIIIQIIQKRQKNACFYG